MRTAIFLVLLFVLSYSIKIQNVKKLADDVAPSQNTTLENHHGPEEHNHGPEEHNHGPEEHNHGPEGHDEDEEECDPETDPDCEWVEEGEDHGDLEDH
jgi:hypothetical protein